MSEQPKPLSDARLAEIRERVEYWHRNPKMVQDIGLNEEIAVSTAFDLLAEIDRLKAEIARDHAIAKAAREFIFAVKLASDALKDCARHPVGFDDGNAHYFAMLEKQRHTLAALEKACGETKGAKN